MKKIILIIVGVIFITGCNKNEIKNNTSTYSTITGSSVIELVTEGAILVDVRSKEEYNEYHLPDAINIPLDDIQAGKIEIGKSKKIIVYCKSGARSKVASQLLIDLGYNNIYDLGSINNYEDTQKQ